jgi:hypothetical protein
MKVELFVAPSPLIKARLDQLEAEGHKIFRTRTFVKLLNGDMLYCYTPERVADRTAGLYYSHLEIHPTALLSADEELRLRSRVRSYEPRR